MGGRKKGDIVKKQLWQLHFDEYYSRPIQPGHYGVRKFEPKSGRGELRVDMPKGLTLSQKVELMKILDNQLNSQGIIHKSEKGVTYWTTTHLVPNYKLTHASHIVRGYLERGKHKQIVKNAYKRGKPVPKNILGSIGIKVKKKRSSKKKR